MGLLHQDHSIPPFRCRQHVAWPLGNMQHVILDHGEVLHIGPGLENSKGVYFHLGIAEAVAEALATRLAQAAS